MNRRYVRFVLSGAFALFLTVTASLTQANPYQHFPISNLWDKVNAELATDWLEWVLAIPATTNPIRDADGTFASNGQSGKVWFLVVTEGGSATRTITAPSNRALFFPVVTHYWVNAPEYGDPVWSDEQEAQVRTYLATVVDTAQNLVLEIDGWRLPPFLYRRLASTVGKCTLPDDNLFGVPLSPAPHECVSDGYWALLPPLPPGSHTVRIAGGFALTGFTMDVTYHINVRRR